MKIRFTAEPQRSLSEIFLLIQSGETAIGSETPSLKAIQAIKNVIPE